MRKVRVVIEGETSATLANIRKYYRLGWSDGGRSGSWQDFEPGRVEIEILVEDIDAPKKAPR